MDRGSRAPRDRHSNKSFRPSIPAAHELRPSLSSEIEIVNRPRPFDLVASTSLCYRAPSRRVPLACGCWPLLTHERR